MKEETSYEQVNVNSNDEFVIKKETRKKEWVTIHNIKIGFFYAIAIFAGCLLFTYAWHLLTPIGWHWLTESEILRLKDQALSMITGLAVGLLINLMNDK